MWYLSLSHTHTHSLSLSLSLSPPLSPSLPLSLYQHLEGSYIRAACAYINLFVNNPIYLLIYLCKFLVSPLTQLGSSQQDPQPVSPASPCHQATPSQTSASCRRCQCVSSWCSASPLRSCLNGLNASRVVGSNCLDTLFLMINHYSWRGKKKRSTFFWLLGGFPLMARKWDAMLGRMNLVKPSSGLAFRLHIKPRSQGLK